jgi:hypothetical protein
MPRKKPNPLEEFKRDYEHVVVRCPQMKDRIAECERLIKEYFMPVADECKKWLATKGVNVNI